VTPNSGRHLRRHNSKEFRVHHVDHPNRPESKDECDSRKLFGPFAGDGLLARLYRKIASQAAEPAPASSGMNSRRLMGLPRPRVTPYHIVVGNAGLCITANLAADVADGSSAPHRCALDARGMSAMPPIPTKLMHHNEPSRGARTGHSQFSSEVSAASSRPARDRLPAHGRIRHYCLFGSGYERYYPWE
jgi:hypothetical protein